MFFFVGQYAFEHASGGRVFVANQCNHLAIGLHGNPLGHQVGFHHGLEV